MFSSETGETTSPAVPTLSVEEVLSVFHIPSSSALFKHMATSCSLPTETTGGTNTSMLVRLLSALSSFCPIYIESASQTEQELTLGI